MAASDLRTRDFQRILLVKPSSLGDILHALPVLSRLRARYPEARIDWLISSAFAPLLRNHPELSGVVEFDRKHYGRMGKSLSVTVHFFRFVRDLRQARYDLAIDLQGLFRSAFLTWCTGAPVRLGFAEAREAAPLFYTHRIPRLPENTHAVDRNLAVSEWLDLPDQRVKFLVPIEPSVRQEAMNLLPHGPGPFIAVCPGARWETKRWDPDHFAVLLDRLGSRSAGRIVLLGGEDERALCERIANRCTSSVTNLAGRTSVSHLVALVEHADLLICHDSAAAHIAVALDRPLLCLTGPTNPARTGPYERPHDVIRRDVPCSPCYLRRLRDCPFEHRCMRDLTIDEVEQAALARLR